MMWGRYGTVTITVSVNPAVSVDPQSELKKKKWERRKSLFTAIDALLYAFACISTSAPLFFSLSFTLVLDLILLDLYTFFSYCSLFVF